MFDTLLSVEWVPFTLSLCLLFALLALELVFALIGFSMLGSDADIDVDADVAVPDIADLDALDIELDIDGLDDFEIPDVATVDGESIEIADSAGGVLAWLGMGKTPFMIWLASVFFGFGASGVALQSVATNTLGDALPLWAAAPVSALVGGWFAGRFGRVFAAILPKTETSSVSTRRFGGHKGVVSQGTARAGQPAEVRINDRHGNLHYLRLEPLKEGETIAQGTEVLILRNRRTGDMKITSLSI